MSALIVSYGGGTNSAAMLVGFHERGIRPDAIVFADTGGEKPRTYGHLLVMQRWCERVGFPSLTIVRGEQPQQVRDGSLEAECVRLGTIPSRAMGFGMCSDKWKRDPQDKWLVRWMAERRLTGTVTKCIGIGADERNRADSRPPGDALCVYRYPLIEWDWDREECEEALQRAGLPSPGKSACFYCPSSKAKEIFRLRVLNPKLLDRALAMERRALNGEGQAPALHSVKGLGRRFSWAQLLREHDAQPDLFNLVPEQCGEGCFT